MNNIDMENLGLSQRFVIEATLYKGLYIGRVISQYKNLYKVVTENGELKAEVSGKFLFEVKTVSDFPAVGDFVMLDRTEDTSGNAIIHNVLTRKSAFIRKAAGTSNEEQIISLWRNYLKDNGYIAVSEISWLIDTRPEEIQQYWVNAYPEIDTIDNKLSVIEKCGYTSVVHFALDDKCWKDNYYQPILEKSEEFLKKYNYADEVKEFVEAGKVEADWC